MTRKLGLLTIAVWLAFAHRTEAQYPYSPGVGFQYSGGRLRIAGFVPLFPVVGPPSSTIVIGPPATVVERRVTVRPVAPPVEYDLSGIDLDVESPDRLYPPGTAPLRPVRPEPVPDRKKPEPPVKQPPPPAPAPAPNKTPEDELFTPRAGAADEARRLTELGLRAFRAGEYGLALWRFRQASGVDPSNARAFFLMAQAFIAVGQYREAMPVLQDGLRLQPDWPTADFRPRAELYKDNPADWLEHRRRLEEAVQREPTEFAYLFLRAYVAWFDGQRPQATEWFLRARARTADPTWVDLFLKHAPVPVVAGG
jgi:hypothetical protein